MAADIQAVLWDFGGVFTTSPFENFNKLEAEVGAPRDFIRRVNSTNPHDNAWAKFESSSVSLDEFDELFAAESAKLGHRIPGKDVVAMLSGSLRPRMVKVLEICRAHFRVACITNNVKAGKGPSMTRDEEKASQVAQVMELFDLVVESSVEGIRKPNPAIYELTCQRLGVRPDGSVFLDDLGINLKPAKAMGMHTIKVLDEAQAIDELARVTGLTFPN
jgi:putative hydrolase of the HAD superfamily